MVKVSEVEYDGGNAGGPGLVTKSTAFVQDSTTDQRVTQFKYDGRDQRRVTINPQAPHSVVMLDNMGRVTAAAGYSDTSGVDYDPYDGSAETDISTDTTAAKTDRLSLSTTLYDEKGRVYESHSYPIVQSTGAKGTGSRVSKTWYDTEGRVAKVQGTTVEKYAYDRVNRRTHTYVIGDCDDTSYNDAIAMSSGDVAVEERQTAYDPDSGLVLMNVTIEREHDGYGTGTGSVLDTNADSDDLKLTAANVAYGRAQITAMWYDDLHRLTDTVAYGTYSGATFDRDGLSIPARSDTALRTTYACNDDGTRLSMTDPRDLETRYTYDDAGRQVTVISNYVNGTPSGTTGADDHHIRYVYTDGLQTKMWVDLDGDNVEDAADQVTTYTYGVTKGASAGDSKIGHGGLLQKVTYPDSSSGTDVVTYAYNAQGQQLYRKDQAGNIIETDYDTAGRETHRRVTTLASGFDGDVRRISTTYEDRGMVALVTSYDNAAAGSGSVVNEVSHAYGEWGLLETLRQDRDSAVDASGSVNDYEVSYTFQKASLSCGRNVVGLATQTIAGVRYDFIYDPSGAGGAGSDRPDLNLNRVVAIERYNQLGNTRVVEYDYLGRTRLVRTDYPVPDVFSTFAGTTAGTYDGLDRFNRTTSSTWTADLTTDQNFYDVDITYDRNSNITVVEDNVYGEAFSYAYTMDERNRLTKAERGTWGRSSITTLDENEVWNQLSQTGNWDLYQLDLDGNGTFTGTDELDDDRTFNVANELTARDTDDNGINDFTLTHDAAGNLTDDGEHYEYEYDAFYRLVRVINRSTSNAVTEYAYNGLGHRVSEINDSDADGSMADETPTWFAYDERWRIVASYVGAADPEEPDEIFVHHRAGLDGRGGSSYIDSVALRLRDTTGGSPHTLDETSYYCQNWRADVVALIDESRNQLEQVRYSPYGVPFLLPAGDMVGVWGEANIDDRDAIIDEYVNATYDVRADLDLDGDVDVDDISAYAGNSGGRGALSLAANGNRLGYAGYVADTHIEGSAWHVRNRVLVSTTGQWTRRDPLGYVDGPSLYRANKSNPVAYVDPMGLVAQINGAMTSARPCHAISQGPLRLQAPNSLSSFCSEATGWSEDDDPEQWPQYGGRCWTDEYEGSGLLQQLLTEILAGGCMPPTIRCRGTRSWSGAKFEWGSCSRLDGGTIYVPCNRGTGFNPSDDVCERLLHEMTHAAQRCRSINDGTCDYDRPSTIDECLDAEFEAYGNMQYLRCNYIDPDTLDYAECMCTNACGSCDSAVFPGLDNFPGYGSDCKSYCLLTRFPDAFLRDPPSPWGL